MLPEFLVGTYKRYKQDTKILATWLTVTARTMGYVSETIPAMQEGSIKPPAKANTKAKSKKQSKQQMKKKSRDEARRIPKEQRIFTISLNEFVPLALHISTNSKTPSTVPALILSLITRVIEARKSSGEWFKANTQEDDNDGHAYFIRILQKVHDILQPHSVSVNNNDAEQGGDLTEIDNLYKHLKLDEPSDQFLNAPDVSRPDHKGVRMMYEFVDVLANSVAKYFEERFAAASLFRDINKICNHLEQVWHEFKDGKTDLMSASIISNTGIELIRRLEEDFFEEFPRFRSIDEHFLRGHKKFDPSHKDAQQLINFMFRTKCAAQNSDPRNADKSYDAAQFNVELFDDAHYIFLDMLDITASWYQGSQGMTKSVYDSKTFGTWDPDANYQELTGAEKYRQNRRILQELLPDLTLVSTTQSGIPILAEDELIRGSRNLFHMPRKSSLIHLWMLASMRLFCDIHHILGRSIGKSFEAIRKLGKAASDTIKDCMRQRDDGKAQFWPVELDEQLEYNFLNRIQQSLFVDEVKEYIDNAARNVKWWKGKVDFELLRRHPWACGLMEFNIRTCAQEVGLHALDLTGSGISTAHLYNALQKENALNVPWPDMETFLELLGDDQVFRGKRPDTPEQYCTRLSLARGISPETFARNRRDRGMLMSKRGPRHLSMNNDLIVKLRDRYVMVVLRRDVSDAEATAYLAQLEKALNDSIHLSSNGTQATVRARDTEDVNKCGKAIARNSRKYDPIELLMSLQFGLSQELPTVSFDYLAFHKSCWEVLKSAATICQPVIESMPPVLQILEAYPNERIILSVDLLLSMGISATKALKMIRKVVMPNLPPVTHEFQQIFDQEAIFKDVGDALCNKIQNGRLRILANVRARKLLKTRPGVICFYLQAVSGGSGRVTFKDHKMWQHKDSACTRSRCVCGVQAIPMLRSGWRQMVTESAAKIFKSDE